MKKFLLSLLTALCTLGTYAVENVTLTYSFKATQTLPNPMTSSLTLTNASGSSIGTWKFFFSLANGGTVTNNKNAGPVFGSSNKALESGAQLQLVSCVDMPSNAIVTTASISVKGNAGGSKSKWALTVNQVSAGESKSMEGLSEAKLEWTDVNLQGKDITFTLDGDATAGIHLAGCSITYYVPDEDATFLDMSFTPDKATINVGEDFSEPKFNFSAKSGETPSLADAGVTFSSDNTDLLSVDAVTGKMTLTEGTTGTATITAKLDGSNTTYSAAPATYTLTVNDPNKAYDVYNFSEMGLDNGTALSSYTHGKSTITFSKGTNTSNEPKYYTSDVTARLYAGNTLTFSVPNDYIITSIDFTPTTLNLTTFSSGTYSGGTWTADANKPVSTVTYTAEKVSIKTITVHYDLKGSVPAKKVATPEIKFDGGTNTVTIECETPNREIYYTTNGEIPTKESNHYTGVFTISESCTIKAIAYVGEDDSEVATYTAKVTATYNDVAAIYGLDADTEFTLTEPVTVVYDAGKHIIVAGKNRNIDLFDNTRNAATFTPGATFTEISGTLSIYHGLYEITKYDAKQGEAVAAPEAKETTIAEINAAEIKNIVCNYVELKNVTIDGTTLKQDDATLSLYNQLGIKDVPTTGTYDIVGIVGTYDKVQFWPISFTEANEVTDALGDILVNGKKYESGATIQALENDTFTFSAKNAYIISYDIYIDDTKMDSGANEEGDDYVTWAVPFAGTFKVCVEAMTLEEEMNELELIVIASEPKEEYLADMSADFIFSQDGANVTNKAYKNGEKFELAAGNANTEGGADDLNGVTLKNGKVSIAFVKGQGASNAPRYWSTYDCRIYAKNTVTISVPSDENYTIKKITFAKADNKNWDLILAESNPGTLDDDKVVWTAGESSDVKSVVFTVEKSKTFIASIKVEFYGPVPDAEIVGFSFGEPSYEYDEDAKTTDVSFDYTLHVNNHHEARNDNYIVVVNLYDKNTQELVKSETYDNTNHSLRGRVANAPRRVVASDASKFEASHLFDGKATATIAGERNLVAKVKYATSLESLPAEDEELVFANPITTSISEIGVDADNDATWYDLTGRRVAAPSKGVFIKKYGNAVSKHMMR